ncbi:hypothetical protein P12x_000186 [Tundrisphaera lichenicola]|uniref:hypothetical protein n=1 Tax=Tundrisphaera lichenicola TaxID=2029860 RepID=UPI003EB89854
MAEGKDLVTNQDRNASAKKALFKLFPYPADSITQIIFGKLEEAENRRQRETVEEIAEMLRESKRESEVQNTEEYARLLIDASPSVGSATNEDKRQRLRDLLFKSLFIPPGDPTWEESMYCLDLLKEIDPVGLYIFAVIATAQSKGQVVGVARYTHLNRWVFIHESSLGSVPNLAHAPNDWFEDSKYHEILVDNSIRSLISKTNLIQYRETLITFGNSCSNTPLYSLTAIGKLLVKWTMEDF